MHGKRMILTINCICNRSVIFLQISMIKLGGSSQAGTLVYTLSGTLVYTLSGKSKCKSIKYIEILKSIIAVKYGYFHFHLFMH